MSTIPAGYSTRARVVNLAASGCVGIVAGVALAAFMLASRDRQLAQAHAQAAAQLPGPAVDRPVATATESSIAHHTYALLWVESSSQPGSRLRGVWLASLTSGHPSVDLLGLEPAPLEGRYQPDLGLPEADLEPHLAGRLEGTVIFDGGDLSELVDRLGGVVILGRRMGGAEVIAFLDAREGHRAEEPLLRQGAALQGLMARLVQGRVQSSMADLLAIPSWSSLGHADLARIVHGYSPLRSDMVRVRLLLGSAEAAP